MLTRTAASILLLLLATTATAQSFSKDRLSDWQFRFYACKHVIMGAAFVTRVMDQQHVTDQEGIDGIAAQLAPLLAKGMLEIEKEYQFSEGEAQFVSDLTFAVVSGMVAGGFELSDTQLMNSGSDICIHTIDDMAQ
ncbi:MAG: hypothetical protein H6897_06845 [Rhodobacteraceae bacterium]|uniref:hypothetical protein n=1 Tax=Albidovulum sp. TaxID=1872424 RepID=UPI00265B1CA3|nr:hypothetical protein [uncultured Defluviimonas sp.]MCC0069631.1 hypothetical protein [Paracoccaceae bacterium]